jgi:hypothetical protein
LAIYIKIERTEYKNGIYFYEVNTNDFKENPFLIGIDPDHKLLHFYRPGSKKPDYSIDIDDPKNIGCGFVSEALAARVWVKARQAWQNNSFPEYLDHCA